MSTTTNNKNHHHSTPKPGMTCLITMDDITKENYAEYRCQPSGKWLPAQMTSEMVLHFISTGWDKYVKDVEAASKDCAAAVRRLVQKGPPLYVSEPKILPLPEGDEYIDEFWFMNGDQTISAKLEGALEGEAREKLHATQLETLKMMELAEGKATT
jgi:hypothetical protein